MISAVFERRNSWQASCTVAVHSSFTSEVMAPLMQAAVPVRFDAKVEGLAGNKIRMVGTFVTSHENENSS
jgi:hypothetical protein